MLVSALEACHEFRIGQPPFVNLAQEQIVKLVLGRNHVVEEDVFQFPLCQFPLNNLAVEIITLLLEITLSKPKYLDQMHAILALLTQHALEGF